MTSTGRLLHIFLRPATRASVREVREANAVAGVGLEGDHAHGGRRQVTIISRAGWDEACAALGKPDVSPGGRRANLVVEGVDLHAALDKRLKIGEVEVQVHAETKPCQLMDDVALGLWDALKPRLRAGVYASIVVGGPLRVGDPIEAPSVAAPPPDPPVV